MRRVKDYDVFDAGWCVFRIEPQAATASRTFRICHRMRIEFAMRELPGAGVLDALGYDREPDRKPVKQQRHHKQEPQLDHDRGAAPEIGPEQTHAPSAIAPIAAHARG